MEYPQLEGLIKVQLLSPTQHNPNKTTLCLRMPPKTELEDAAINISRLKSTEKPNI